jgi:hypothetical protein
MDPVRREQFNRSFTPEKYRRFLAELNADCGTEIQFRVSETPCFIPRALLDKMSRYGSELVTQLLDDPEYLRASESAIPQRFKIRNEARRPNFLQVDFGLVRTPAGDIQPKLVELQAFPSLYAYQPMLAHRYVESYVLPGDLQPFLGDLDEASYWRLLSEIILAGQDPKNVVLLEIDPLEQKTLPDFLLTREKIGIEIVNIRDVVQRGRQLLYRKPGREIPIERIYNRVILDELVRKGVPPPFDLSAELDVSWAGDTNWYFRISKFSIPYLRHECVPKASFLDELEHLPPDRENYLLKPLYSFAGAGIKFAPTDADIAAIPADQRHDYLLQERVHFTPVIKTPHGDTQMEVRIMFLWPEGGELTPVLPLIRMGRGKMMGVDHNRNLEWVGGAAGFGV